MTEEEFKSLIESLRVDLKLVEDMLHEVAQDIMNEGFSSYPVFIATAHEINLGELVLNKDDLSASFNIYATTLEELVTHRLVLPEKKDQFIKTFREPGQFMCVMLLTDAIASFIFLPYSKGAGQA